MFPPKNILFPVDFSERCHGGARMVEIFAGHFDAEIAMLHVVEPPTYSDIAIDNTPVAQRQLEVYLAEEMKHFAVRRVLTHGDPAMRIIDYANSGRFDLIVIPTHGYGGFRRLVLGSVAARVLDHANCPVCTGAHMEDTPPLERIEIRNVLCAIDLGKQSCPAMTLATCVAAEFGAGITLVHAVPAAHNGATPATDPDWKTELMGDAKARIAKLQETIGSDAEVIVAAGEAPNVVHDAAVQTHANLVVIGRSLREGMLGRLRANAYSIIRQSPCPVISV